MQETNMILLEEKDDMHEFWEPASTIEKHLNNAKDYADYLPGLWKNITQEEQEAGHGGMDYLMLKTFVDAVLSGKEMPTPVGGDVSPTFTTFLWRCKSWHRKLLA